MNNTRVSIFKTLVQKREFPATSALIVLFILLSVASPNFLTMDNLMNMAKQAAVIGLVAMGEALILISGEVDLSVGAMLGFCGIMAAILWENGMPPAAIFIGVLLIGGGISAVSALFIVKLRLAAFAVTLGMMSILKGAMLVITGGFQLKFESPLAVLGYGYLGKIPYGVIIMAVLLVVLYILLMHTPFGKKVFATGSNSVAAKISGINTGSIKILCFVITGMLCGLGGLLMSGSVLSAGATTGIGYENDIVAACVIGGTTLRGGEGSILGVVIGSILLGTVKNGFVLLNIESSWQLVATGSIIVLSIIIDSLKNKKQNRY